MCYDSIYSVYLPRVWWCVCVMVCVCDGVCVWWSFTCGPEGLLKVLTDLSPDKGNSGLNIADNKLPINTLWPVEFECHEGFTNNAWHTVGLYKCSLHDTPIRK